MITIKGINPKMIANNLSASEASHPGELIKEEVKARGMSQKQLASQMDLSYTVLNDIIRGRRGINTECALLLEAALGIEASLWLKLQADYDMQVVKHDSSFMEKLKKVRQIAAAL
jgi:addiction module HigA family antidote